MKAVFSGQGPGPQTADGCSVEFYRRLPYLGELDELRTFLGAGTTVLELGCGSGRLTRCLLDWGCRVTAVDESAEMLRHVDARAQAVRARIETLSLIGRWEIVLLASCLINHPDPAARAALVACAARHLQEGGQVLMERHDPLWLRSARPGPAGRVLPGLAVIVEAAEHRTDSSDIDLRYEVDGLAWRQQFSAAHLGTADIEALLGATGFGAMQWFGAGERWVAARWRA